MKKPLLFSLLALATLPAFAQKLSLKKDEFRVDGDPVAKIEEKRSQNIINKDFVINNMKDEPMITMKVHTIMNPIGYNNPSWYEVHFVASDKTLTREVPKGLFGIRKELLEEFVDLNVIGKDGVNEEGMNKYLAAHSLDLGVRNQTAMDSIGALTAKGSYVKPRSSGKIRVDDGIIKEGGVQIGTYEVDGDKNSLSINYIVRNDQGGIVGVTRISKGDQSRPVEVIMFLTGSRYNYTGSEAGGIDVDDSPRTIVEKFVRYAMSKHNM